MNISRVAALSIFTAFIVQGCSCKKDGPSTSQTFGEISFVGQDDKLVTDTVTYDFGAVYMGQPQGKTLGIKVRNTSSGALRLQTLKKELGDAFSNGTESDGDAPVFKVAFTPNRDVAPGETVTIDATFVPASLSEKVHEHAVTLKLTAGNTRVGRETATIKLVGRGVSGVCELPETIDFGSVAAGDTAKQFIDMKNPTELPAAAYVGDVTGADASVFKMSLDSPKGSFDIAPNTSRIVTLTFEPTKTREQPFQGYLRMRASAECPEVIVNLVGNAVQSVLTWEPKGCVNFGYVTPNVEVQREITFRNSGNSAVNMSAIKTLAPAEFRVVGGDSPDLSKLTVAAHGGTAKLKIAFKPSILGPRKSQLTYQTNLAKKPPDVCLEGFGGGPDIQVNPAPTLNFGKVAYFASSPTPQLRKLTVMNVGTRPLQPDANANLRLGKNGVDRPFADVRPLGTTQDKEITIIEPSSYDPAVGLVAQAGQNLAEFQVKVNPTSPGLKSAEVVFLSNDPDEPEVKITVTAEAVVVPPCKFSLTPGHLSFGLVTPPDYKQLSFTITNDGRNAGEVCLISNVDITPGSDPEFSLPAGPVASRELQPGQSMEVLTRVWPQKAPTNGVPTLDGSVEFYVSSPTTPTASVTLDATVGTSCLTIAPDDLDFGTVRRNCRSSTRTFNVYNTCTSALRITGFSLQDAAGQKGGGPDCSGSSPCPEFFLQATPAIPSGGLTLNPSATPLTFQAYYRPIDLGQDNGAIAVDVIQNNQAVKYLVLLAGAGDLEGKNTDTFTQDGKPKADILLTIDDSGSMSDEQASLAANFASFIKYAASASIDYHIGVTTTDDSPGLRGILRGDPKVITPQTESREARFAANVNVGTNGSSTEMGFAPSLAALTAPLVTAENAGFLREEANLAVVVVTDELEQSPQPTSFYYNSFLNIKGFKRATAFTFNAIAGFSPTCAASLDDGRYTQMTTLTNGVRENICTTDWGKSLEQLGKTAFGFRTNFFLNATPDLSSGRSITVTVDGRVMPPTDAAGAPVWHYEQATNAIIFEPMYVPEPGQTMTVSYSVNCF